MSPTARLAAAFDAAGDDPDALATAAVAVLADPDWASAIVRAHLTALAEDWFAEPPIRVGGDALRTGIVLFTHSSVQISATVLRAKVLRLQPRAPTMVVAGRLSVVRYVRGGGATLRRWAADRADEGFSQGAAAQCRPLPPIRLTDGLVRISDGRSEAVLIEDARDDVVTLTATIMSGAASVMREYDRTAGRLCRAAALDDAASRAQMLVELLRQAPPAVAALGFAAAVADRAFYVRWAAMRAWLSRDLAGAWPTLVRLADRDPHPEVRAAARATLARLDARRAA